MISNWALPRSITQYAEDNAENIHVSWQDTENFQALKTKNGKFIKTSRDLVHIARDPRHDIKEKTYFLKCTNFDFVNVPSIITGIEMKLTSNRYGRITDETIQLCLNDQLIGNNLTTRDLDPIKIYGADNNMWGTNLSLSDITNSSFGIVLRFQSHPNWPHKSSMLIDSVELRVY